MLRDEYERAVLLELRKPYHGGTLRSNELASVIELPHRTVLSTLHELAKPARGLVEQQGRGNPAWAYFSITERGLEELVRDNQMRLVK